MSSLESFIAEFDQFCRDRDLNRIMALNAPGEISGWGVGENDVFPSRVALEDSVIDRNRRIKLGECRQHPVMVFGEKPVTCLLTQVEFTEHHFDGSIRKYSGYATWFLEWIDDAWRIRHGHWGIPLGDTDSHIDYPYLSPVLAEPTDRLTGSVMENLNKWLHKRSSLLEAGDANGMTDLLYPRGDIVIWGMCKAEECSSIEDARTWYERMLKIYHMSITYLDPIAFSCGDLVCLSAHGDMTATKRDTKTVSRVRPLRSTFILEKFEGEWRARHIHISVPVDI